MGMFSKLFGGGESQAAASRGAQGQPEQYAPGTQISYDAQLIPRFEGHHQSLLKLFGSLSEAAEKSDYASVATTLKTFLRVLDQHVLEENLKLYVYLEKCIDDQHHQEMIHEMKREMGEIGHTVHAFARHHTQFGVNDQNIGKFREELRQIGEALKDRIQREEESLYTLYVPPETYAGV